MPMNRMSKIVKASFSTAIKLEWSLKIFYIWKLLFLLSRCFSLTIKTTAGTPPRHVIVERLVGA